MLMTSIPIFMVYHQMQILDVPEDSTECEYFTVISIDFLLFYNNKYYLHS